MAAIDVQSAKQMVQQYTATRRNLINKTYGINDTKAIWFSIDQVKAFMADLTPDATGVRIYLGAYADNDPAFPKQTSIIAVGTTKDASGSHVDPVGQNTAIKPLDEGGSSSGGPHNHGDLCPPNTGCN